MSGYDVLNINTRRIMNTKLVLAICCFSFFMSSLQAQQFSLGPLVSYNYTWVAGNDNRSDGFHGVGAGAKLTYSSLQNWGISGMFAYSQEGFRNTIGGLETKTTLHYLRIPLRFDYFFGKMGDDFRPKIYIGPSLGILGKATSEIGSAKVTVTDSYKPFDLGLAVGTGFNYRLAPSTWLNIDVTYTHGLVSIPENGADLKSRGLNIGAGVAFGF